MKYFALILLLGCSSAYAEWTNVPPVKVTVWSFDKKCVQLKLPDGSIRSVPKESLKTKKFESRVTKFEVYLESLPKEPCGK